MIRVDRRRVDTRFFSAEWLEKLSPCDQGVQTCPSYRKDRFRGQKSGLFCLWIPIFQSSPRGSRSENCSSRHHGSESNQGRQTSFFCHVLVFCNYHASFQASVSGSSLSYSESLFLVSYLLCMQYTNADFNPDRTDSLAEASVLLPVVIVTPVPESVASISEPQAD